MHPKRSPQAFSLIELLAALTCGALLLLLAFAGGSSMIQKSREMGCVTHLRQLYSGLILYSHDHNQRLPFGARVPDEPEINANYYAGIYAREFKQYIPGLNKPGYTTGHVDPYLCPADRETRAGAGRGFLGHSYGVNMTICRNTNNDKSDLPYSRTTTWRFPGQTFLLADSLSAVIARSKPAANLAPRHRGGANALFCDGHVEWRAAPFPDWSENRAFWVPDYE